MNAVLLRGEIITEAVFSHESHGIRYHQLDLSTMRLSKVPDTLRLLVSEDTLAEYTPRLGDNVEVEGQIRSFNNKSGVGSKLVISVLAQKLSQTNQAHCNKIEITGTLCKPAMYRRTPLGREICDLMVAVVRPYGRADYLPVIAWGVCARICTNLEIGDKISIEGRLQSRKYTKLVDGQPVEKKAYEISAVHIDTNVEDNSKPST